MQNLKEKFFNSIRNNRQQNSGFWKITKNLCMSEINQKEKFALETVNQILFSKRLLSDHVEALELCFPLIAPPQSYEYFTLRNSSIAVICLVLQKMITPQAYRFTILPVSLLAGGLFGLYLVKKISDVKLKYLEREMDKCIQALETYANCIKRNILYFNEILVMNPKELIECRHIDRAWDCITAVKEVIDILSDATRNMEETYELSSKFKDLYMPLEELKDSPYFNKNITDFDQKNIKDFYNIYSYVQSQFLLRLGLTVCEYGRNPFILQIVPEIQQLIQQHIKEEDEHFINLSFQLKAKHIEMSQIYEKHPVFKQCSPISNLKCDSLKLSSCIIAAAEECQKLNIYLQKVNDVKFTISVSKDFGSNDSFLDVSNSLKVIENSLEMCLIDVQRLTIMYNKFTSTIDSHELESDASNANDDFQSIEGSFASDSRKIDDDHELEKKDEFFAYIQDSKEDHEKCITNNKQDYDFELLNLDEKVTKGKFKPVLKQLKIKIEPIKKEMLEKEKKVLESKGIDVSKFTDETLPDYADKEGGDFEIATNKSGSEGSADELEKTIERPIKDNYEETRNFLAQKAALNIFKNANVPLKTHIVEDILE